MIKFSTRVNVPPDRRVTVTVPPDVPIGPAEVEVQLEPTSQFPNTVGDGPSGDAKLNREWAAFHAMLPQLLQTHRGQYVAIHGGSVVGSGQDKVAVALHAQKRFGNVPILVREITESPRVVRIVTPFRRPPVQET